MGSLRRGRQSFAFDRHPAIAARLKKRLAEHVRNGRSTPGPRQKNNGQEIWDAVRWLEED